MNTENVYVALNKSFKTTKKNVQVKDVASVWSPDLRLKNMIDNIQIMIFENPKEEKGELIRCINVLDIMEIITNNLVKMKYEKNVDYQSIGQEEVLIIYEKENTENNIKNILKTILICLIIFFGAAFAIMSFNEDVAVKKLFEKIYKLVLGKKKTGFGVLEFTYGIGIATGIIIFFNHFGRKKLTNEPTPIEVKMKQYDDDVNNYWADNIKGN